MRGGEVVTGRPMVGPERIEWRRSAPVRDLVRLASYAIAAAGVIAVVWVLFGGEPEYLAGGRPNPLASVPVFVAWLAAVGAVVVVVPIVRRPVVAANRFALRIRPGAVRTLTLPWDEVAEVAAVKVGGEPYLVVRRRRRVGLGDRPASLDQRLLRKIQRAADGALDRYDLAVRLHDFAGAPAGRLGSLAAFAPDEVVFSDRL